MFKCANCSRQTNPKEKGTMRTIKTRVKEYVDAYGKYQGTGEEIVSEIRICRICEEAEATEYPGAVEKLDRAIEESIKTS